MNKYLGYTLAGVVMVYQLTLGTLFAGRCRYEPTCSEYSRLALIKHGAFRGLGKTIWRLLRCNPWSRGGSDPV